MNLLCPKLNASSSFQSKDTVEADSLLPSLKQGSQNTLGIGLTWACQHTVAWPLWNCFHKFSQFLYYLFSQKQVEYKVTINMTPFTRSSPWTITDFYDKEIPKVDPNHTCLAEISLDSALNKCGLYLLLLVWNRKVTRTSSNYI